MLWFKAFHVIAIVCWFAGLFYLPRLYVYHAAKPHDAINQQFKIMEHRLYYYITTPAAIATLLFGLALWLPNYDSYRHAMWLHIKLILVLLLIIYHGYCGYLLHRFKQDDNPFSVRFYRYFNEVPTLILIAVVLLTFLKP
ncbi:MAG: protoporphyrinogen oxidase HemJ [Gammaproteobacteria bacterium]|nr:protoporphyrinogen oxidase HemJ [Gammaproteobacteria bacterium]